MATQAGVPPEQLAVEWLKAAGFHATSDPLEPFIGALAANVPGWADRHDELLGETLRDELSGKDLTDVEVVHADAPLEAEAGELLSKRLDGLLASTRTRTCPILHSLTI